MFNFSYMQNIFIGTQLFISLSLIHYHLTPYHMNIYTLLNNDLCDVIYSELLRGLMICTDLQKKTVAHFFAAVKCILNLLMNFYYGN